jgi:hypothetical protein
MRKARTHKDIFNVDHGRIIGRDQRRTYGKYEDEQNKHPADDREAVFQEVMKGL